jgi:hypothetical protein
VIPMSLYPPVRRKENQRDGINQTMGDKDATIDFLICFSPTGAAEGESSDHRSPNSHRQSYFLYG